MQNGMTLVELMIVIAIISILSAVVIPTLSYNTSKAKDSKAIATLSNVRTNLMMAVADLDMQVPKTSSGKGLWNRNVNLISFDGAISVEGVNVGGVDIITDKIIVGNYGTSIAPQLYYSDLGHREMVDGGRNVIFTTASGMDTRGKSWNSY